MRNNNDPNMPIWHFTRVTPPEDLYADICYRIVQEKRRVARTHLVLLSSGIVISSIALVPAFQYTMQEFGQSSFLQYISLLFSDGGFVALGWKEFLLVLAESAPLLGLTILLALTLTILGALRAALGSARTAFSLT